MDSARFSSRRFALPFFLLVALAFPSRAQSPSGPLEVRWRAAVGQTTFRTTMAFTHGFVVIGTHGATLDGLDEGSDGVYLLSPETGTVERILRAPGTGDLDVGGMAVAGDTLYFTTDNGWVVATGFDGRQRWSRRLGGKIRPAPALGFLNGDEAPDVVAGDETGRLVAFDGVTGEVLWSHLSGSNEYGSRGYVAAPAIADLDGDGRDDVVAGARDGVLAALSGVDGTLLWRAHPRWSSYGPTGIHASPSLADLDADGRDELISAWSYSTLLVLDARSGAQRWTKAIHQGGLGGIEGFFASPIPVPAPQGGGGVFVEGTSWWGDREDGVVGVGPDGRRFKFVVGRVSATAVVTDLDGDGIQAAVVGTEEGELLEIDAAGRARVLARLGGPIEASAMLADLDGDGAFELLVASNDGVLTCFETGSKAPPLVSRFRGDSLLNQGRLGSVDLGAGFAEALRVPVER
ncbi:MAG TPA: hypothetical protein ENJ09_04930 [Planctomycetes bacterium]|nr:hypothetical protein [Planctomycetota bacterium]